VFLALHSSEQSYDAMHDPRIKHCEMELSEDLARFDFVLEQSAVINWKKKRKKKMKKRIDERELPESGIESF